MILILSPMVRQAYPRMGKAFLMAGELEEADRAYQIGTAEVLPHLFGYEAIELMPSECVKPTPFTST